MSLEQQLAAYRAKKAQEKDTLDNNHDSQINKVFQLLNFRSRKRNMSEAQQECVKEELNGSIDDPSQIARPLLNETIPTYPTSDVNQNSFLGRLLHNNKLLFKGTTILKLLLWLILWGLFIELEFGSVYFILSLFYFVYTSMRAGSRDRTQLSAYSVFNPNFERLEGTFTAEQFEKELKFGAASVH